jgi:hypothetical protein
VIACGLYGSLIFIPYDQNYLFIILSLVGRFFHGFEDNVHECMSVFYLASSSDEKTKDRAFSIYKIVGGVGFFLGSLICPVIYIYLGFFLSFQLLSLFYISFSIMIVMVFPKDQDFL